MTTQPSTGPTQLQAPSASSVYLEGFLVALMPHLHLCPSTVDGRQVIHMPEASGRGLVQDLSGLLELIIVLIEPGSPWTSKGGGIAAISTEVTLTPT